MGHPLIKWTNMSVSGLLVHLRPVFILGKCGSQAATLSEFTSITAG